MDYKKYSNELGDARYDMWNWRDMENEISYLQGYFCGKEESTLEDNVSVYLNDEYNIDCNYNSVIEQIVHYAYLKNKDLLSSLSCIFYEMDQKKDLLPLILKSPYVSTSILELKVEIFDLESVVLKNGLILSKGDSLTLADLLGDAYKTTKQFDSSIKNPSYDIFYPSEKDFKHICFYSLDEDTGVVEVFGQVWRIFSEITQQIKFIKQNKDGSIVVYTELFRVEVEEALENEELLIGTVKREIFNLKFLKMDLEDYSKGKRYGPISKLIAEWCWNSPIHLKPIWWNYTRKMNGSWYKSN